MNVLIKENIPSIEQHFTKKMLFCYKFKLEKKLFFNNASNIAIFIYFHILHNY